MDTAFFREGIHRRSVGGRRSSRSSRTAVGYAGSGIWLAISRLGAASTDHSDCPWVSIHGASFPLFMYELVCVRINIPNRHLTCVKNLPVTAKSTRPAGQRVAEREIRHPGRVGRAQWDVSYLYEPYRVRTGQSDVDDAAYTGRCAGGSHHRFVCAGTNCTRQGSCQAAPVSRARALTDGDRVKLRVARALQIGGGLHNRNSAIF